MTSVSYYLSPLGRVEITASRGGIVSVILSNDRFDGFERAYSGVVAECVRQLDEYFDGRRMKFDLPVRQHGTAFQHNVWDALTNIPFGKTASYASIAATLNRPRSARAIGGACRRNSVWIIVPCHRVVGSNGSLTGYAGGLESKEWLLNHEAKIFKLNS